MKQGRTINEITTLLADIHENARDLVVPANQLGNVVAEVASTRQSQLTVEDVLQQTEAAIAAEAEALKIGDFQLTVRNGSVHSFAPTKHAHGQLAGYAEIPSQYYQRLLVENRPLLAANVNHGMQVAAARVQAKASQTGRLLRTYRGKLRAVLSSRYRRLDCWDLMQAVGPSLIELGFEPMSCELTDTRLYIKCVSPRVTGEVAVGDVVQYGLVISGSDVGEGIVRVEPMVYRLKCSNGMICEAAIKQAHIGRNQAGEEIEELLTEETRHLSDVAFWHQVRDVVQGMARPEVFQAEVDKIKAAAGLPITQYNLPILVQRACKEIGGVNLTEALKGKMVENLAHGAHGAGMNKWGLANAFTFAAHAVPDLDYDAATDMERAGSRILALTEKSWGFLNRPLAREEKEFRG